MLRKVLPTALVGFSVSFATFAGVAIAAVKSHRDESEKNNRDVHELQRANRGLGEIERQSACPPNEIPCSTVTQKVKGYRVVS